MRVSGAFCEGQPPTVLTLNLESGRIDVAVFRVSHYWCVWRPRSRFKAAAGASQNETENNFSVCFLIWTPHASEQRDFQKPVKSVGIGKALPLSSTMCAAGVREATVPIFR